jgi:hypothetical protein
MSEQHWTKKAGSGLLLLVAIAVGARTAYGLLVPLLPVACVAIVLVAVYAVVVGRR